MDGVLKRQLVAAWCVIFTESFNENYILPFLPFMVKNFGIDDDSVGLYVGILASSYFVFQFLSSMLWVKISEKIDKRLCMMFGLGSSVINNVLFGLSSSMGTHGYIYALLFRCMMTAFNGNGALIRSYVREITTMETRVNGFGMLVSGYGMGVLLSSACGGFLSGSGIYSSFPYLLPAICASLVNAFAFIVILNAPKSVNTVETSIGSGSDVVVNLKPNPHNNVDDRLKNKIPIVGMLCYATSVFLWVIYDVTFAVFCQTSLTQGGLAINQEMIGILLFIASLTMVIIQNVGIFVYFSKKIGSLSFYRIIITIGFFYLLLLPVLDITVGRFGSSSANTWVILIIFMVVRGIINSSIYMAITIHINDSVSALSTLPINGYIMSISSFFMSIGNVTGGLMWSNMMSWDNIGEYRSRLFFWMISFLGLINCIISIFIEKSVNV